MYIRGAVKKKTSLSLSFSLSPSDRDAQGALAFQHDTSTARLAVKRYGDMPSVDPGAANVLKRISKEQSYQHYSVASRELVLGYNGHPLVPGGNITPSLTTRKPGCATHSTTAPRSFCHTNSTSCPSRYEHGKPSFHIKQPSTRTMSASLRSYHKWPDMILND